MTQKLKECSPEERARLDRCNARARANYAADPEKERARLRDRYAKDPEKHRARALALRLADPEKFRAQTNARYAKDPEAHRARANALRAKDPEKFRARLRARYAKDPEAHRARSAAIRADDPEKHRAREREIAAQHPERGRAKRRAAAEKLRATHLAEAEAAPPGRQLQVGGIAAPLAEVHQGATGTKTYLIAGGGHVKIGRTGLAVVVRMVPMQTGNPYDLRIVICFSGDRERELHELFAEHNERGEWFRVEGSLADFMAEIEQRV